MARIILLNKPFGVLSQFTGDQTENTLAPLIPQKGFYPAGRLDKDSEGLLLLTDDGKLQQTLSNPRYKKSKVYCAQVEGIPDAAALEKLRSGVLLKDGKTLPADAQLIEDANFWARTPPIRERKLIPTSWVKLTLREGKNRQVRRMTAAVGFPTLRLVRVQVSQWELGRLLPGEHRMIELS